MSFCLHSALIAPNILIINSYHACRQLRFLSTHGLHFLMMHITLYCGGIACNTHRESEKSVTPTGNTLPLCRTSRVAQPLKSSAQTSKKRLATYMVQTVHTTIMMRAACRQQCTQSADLSTRRNTLIFNTIQAKVQSADKITKSRVGHDPEHLCTHILRHTRLLSHTATAPTMDTPFWQTLAYNNATSQKDQAPVPQQHINTAKIKSSCR